MGDREVGRGRIKTQPGKFSIAAEGLNIGKDSGEPVTGYYPGQAPWAFTGGTIRRAAVDVSGEPFTDLAAEAHGVPARLKRPQVRRGPTARPGPAVRPCRARRVGAAWRSARRGGRRGR
jgi:hypothetical protein